MSSCSSATGMAGPIPVVAASWGLGWWGGSLRTEAPNSVRRIVTIDDDNGKSVAIHDGPTPDVRTDPARPGFASMRIWVTDTTPASVAHVRDPLALPHSIEPPPRGSVCRIVTIPPDATFRGKVGAD